MASPAGRETCNPFIPLTVPSEHGFSTPARPAKAALATLMGSVFAILPLLFVMLSVAHENDNVRFLAVGVLTWTGIPGGVCAILAAQVANGRSTLRELVLLLGAVLLPVSGLLLFNIPHPVGAVIPLSVLWLQGIMQLLITWLWGRFFCGNCRPDQHAG